MPRLTPAAPPPTRSLRQCYAKLSTSSLLDRRLGEVVLAVRAALDTRIMHGEHFDSGWSVVRPTGSARLVYLADQPGDGR